MTKNLKQKSPKSDSTSKRPIQMAKPMYILKQLMAIYLNELKGNEPLDLSDVTIPWENNEDIPGEDEIFPFRELDTLALEDNKTGRQIPDITATAPHEYIRKVVEEYYSSNARDQFDFLIWYSKIMETMRKDCQGIEPPIPDRLTESIIQPTICEMMGAKQCDKLPKAVKLFKKEIPFKPKSCYEFNVEQGAKLIANCLVQLYHLYASFLYNYYVNTRAFFMTEENIDNTAA